MMLLDYRVFLHEMCMTYLCIHSISLRELEIGDIRDLHISLWCFSKTSLFPNWKKKWHISSLHPPWPTSQPKSLVFGPLFFGEIPASSASSKSFRRASHSCFQGPLPSHTAPATCELSKTEKLGKPWCFRSLFWAAMWTKMQLEKNKKWQRLSFLLFSPKRTFIISHVHLPRNSLKWYPETPVPIVFHYGSLRMYIHIQKYK